MTISHARTPGGKGELICADVSERSLEVAGARYGDGHRSLLIRNDRLPLGAAEVDLERAIRLIKAAKPAE